MKRFRFALLLSLLAATLFGAASAAKAQTVGLYVTATGTRLNIPNTSWIYGATMGGYFDSNRFTFLKLKPGIDARGAFLFGNSNEALYTAMAGPRISFHPKKIHIVPYGEALFGLGNLTYGEGYPSYTSNSFEYQILGGADIKLTQRFDWRPIEFGVGHLSDVNGTYYPKSISTGFVFRLK